jgi:hypothetical protein
MLKKSLSEQANGMLDTSTSNRIYPAMWPNLVVNSGPCLQVILDFLGMQLFLSSE